MIKHYSSPTDNGGKYAVTHFHTLTRSTDYSLVEFRLETGRKNQIRVHTADMGHPVCGDIKYGNGGGFSSFFENLFGGRGGSSRAGGFGGAGEGFGTGGFGAGQQSGRNSSGEMNMNVNIDMYTALLGGEGIIKLSNGSKIKLKIKPETQNGTKVRVRGKGYDRGDGTFGDLIITYNVKLPTGLNDRQKELLRQMKEAK